MSSLDSQAQNKPRQPPCTEESQHGLYAAHKRSIGMPPTFYVDLDLDPSKRWDRVITAKLSELKAMIEQAKKLIPSKIIEAVDEFLPKIIRNLPSPYGEEIVGIAKKSGIPEGEILLFNIFYEIFTVCTSIVAQDKRGNLYHARNLDFGLFMGWDFKKHTWLMTEFLRPLVINVEYLRGGKVLYKSVNFAGYVGIITAVKPGIYSFSLDERFNLDGGYVGILEWILGKRTGHWTTFLSRDAMEKATSYDEAVEMLSTNETLAPVYYIVGGLKPGEGAIITRDRTHAVNTLTLDPDKGHWYIVETNYDNWEKPPFFDDRRTPAKKALNETGQQNIDFSTMYDVLSTKPVLNELTTFTALMQVKDGKLETYIRECLDPCYPW